MRFDATGADKLVRGLNKIDARKFEAVLKLSMTDIYNRGKAPGGTPFRTGELRQSLGISRDGDGYVVGYTKEYAPDVEYGHRTRGGSYVRGQAYLRRNVDAQRQQLQQDLADVMRQGGVS